MKIYAPVEKRTFIIPPETCLEITKRTKNDGQFMCEIDGTLYYLARTQLLLNGMIEAEFVSYSSVEIEVKADE